MDYIRAEGDFHKEIHSLKDQQVRNKTGRTEWESGELSGEFMQRNTAERDLETETDPSTEYKGVGKLGGFLTKTLTATCPPREGQPMGTVWKRHVSDWLTTRIRVNFNWNWLTTRIRVNFNWNWLTTRIRVNFNWNWLTTRIRVNFNWKVFF